MSWAEIKKAVNDDISKPLNKLFGLRYVTRGMAGSTPVKISNTSGILIFSFSGAQQGKVYMDGNLANDVFYVDPANTWQCIVVTIPLDKEHDYYIVGTSSQSSYYTVYSFWGASNHIFRKEVCVA